MQKHKKNTLSIHSLLIRIVVMSFCLLPPLAQAECGNLPDSIDYSCKNCDFPGAVWKLSNDHKTYNPEFLWQGEASDQFELIVVDGNMNQVPWPYPLGQGLYVAITGTFKITGPNDQKFEVQISDPSQQFGMSSIADFLLPEKVTEGRFVFDDSSFFALYIMSTGVGDVDGEITPPPTDLQFRIRSKKTKGDITDDEGNLNLVCTSSSISVESPCSIMADPTVIAFKDLKATGSNLSRPEDIQRTNVSVMCDKKANRNIYLRIYPANLPSDGSNIALFNHVDSGELFKGLGLIYKLHNEPLSCDGGDRWQESILLGSNEESNPVKGTIYWGLCRTSERADTGAYETTAIIRFWVD